MVAYTRQLSNRQIRWSGCGWQVIDELKQQNSSFFALRGDSWQILGLDTAIMDNFNWAFAFKGKNAMPFLPDDQIEWALNQIEVRTSTAPCTVRLKQYLFTELPNLWQTSPLQMQRLPVTSSVSEQRTSASAAQ